MVFEKIVNEDIILEKRDNKHLFLESDFPKKRKKSNFFEARNCYISIEYVNDIEEITNDMVKILDLDGNTMYYFETEVEAEKFIRDLNIVDGYRIVKEVINELKNKDVYFVQFAKTIDIMFDKKGTIDVDGVYESFIDNMDGSIEYLNAYLIKEASN